jgi:hypothetical protein
MKETGPVWTPLGPEKKQPSFMKRLSEAILFISALFLLLVIGAGAGAWFTFFRMCPVIEERVVQNVNSALLEAGYKKIIFHSGDFGEVRLRIKQKRLSKETMKN